VRRLTSCRRDPWTRGESLCAAAGTCFVASDDTDELEAAGNGYLAQVLMKRHARDRHGHADRGDAAPSSGSIRSSPTRRTTPARDRLAHRGAVGRAARASPPSARAMETETARTPDPGLAMSRAFARTQRGARRWRRSVDGQVEVLARATRRTPRPGWESTIRPRGHERRDHRRAAAVACTCRRDGLSSGGRHPRPVRGGTPRGAATLVPMTTWRAPRRQPVRYELIEAGRWVPAHHSTAGSQSCLVAAGRGRRTARRLRTAPREIRKAH